MTTRDEELDEVERALHVPYVESPDEVNIPRGGTCWIDQHRPCGPDCVAFNVQRDTANTADQCLHLVHREESLAGKASIIAGIERVLSQLVQIRRQQSQDTPPPAPPKVKT
jgi:hypothetical protein